MKLSIGSKAFFAILTVTVAILLITALAVHLSFQRGLIAYVNDLRRARVEVLAERLGERYAQAGDWQFLREDRRLLHTMMSRSGRPRPARPRRGERAPFPPGDPVNSVRGFAIVDLDGNVVSGPPRPHGERFEIRAANELVGLLVAPPLRTLSADVDVRFAAQQRRWLAGILTFGLGLAGLAGWFIARQLSTPVRALAEGTRALTAGRFGATIDVRQDDELGQLAADFNALSATLAANQARRRELLADVSHELRTPLTALRARLAALRDGVHPLDDDALGALEPQVDRLVSLVDDLYQLSLADAGALAMQTAPVDFCTLVRDALALATPRFEDQGLQVETSLPSQPLIVQADSERLARLLANLFENSARYTDRGGRVRVCVELRDARLRLIVEDSAPGVPDEALPRLFERLYRVDKSRSRGLGGAGLGLALARRIVEAHGGRIGAQASSLGGLRVIVDLDAANHA